MKQRGFTLLELLVVTGIVAVLSGMLFPVFAKAKDTAKAAECLSNVRQVGVAWHLYANDADERACLSYYYLDNFSREIAWDFELRWDDPERPETKPGLLARYAREGRLHRCPTFHGERWGRPHTGMAYNVSFIGGDVLSGRREAAVGSIGDPAGTALFADAGFGNPVAGHNYLRSPSDPFFGIGTVHFRHGRGANVAFADGHTKRWSLRFFEKDSEPGTGALSADDSAYDLE
ncbi:MAG: hypothetical protein HONBIEJF_02370 [Fimbriimonadaceae bacterium]|nr:hypothetical protein [Fimbriimonadaceae bacterium]